MARPCFWAGETPRKNTETILWTPSKKETHSFVANCEQTHLTTDLEDPLWSRRGNLLGITPLVLRMIFRRDPGGFRGNVDTQVHRLVLREFTQRNTSEPSFSEAGSGKRGVLHPGDMPLEKRPRGPVSRGRAGVVCWVNMCRPVKRRCSSGFSQ